MRSTLFKLKRMTEMSADWYYSSKAGAGRSIDLVSGLIKQFNWRLSKSRRLVNVKLGEAIKCHTPTLLDFSG